MRLAGQDSRRGTFVQRHSVLHDRANGQEWIPLANLSENQGRFWVYDSLLSEYAAMAFEYGYSVERADALVLWEAQFGDFANGAQSVIDEFISSAEQKWGQQSSVVLLLPHGYEGQGPDHSSARIERYLQMCAQDNMTVARPSTPASYFHLLRRQAYARPRRPLDRVHAEGDAAPARRDEPGRGLPHRPVRAGARRRPRPRQDAAVKRVLLHSGKIHWDLKAELDKNPNPEIALVRLEQFYPAPIDELNAVHRQLPERPAVLGAGRAREPGRVAVHRARGRQAPARTHDPARLAAVRGVDGDRLAEGARDRAGRDHEEGADALASTARRADAVGIRRLRHRPPRRRDPRRARTDRRRRDRGRGEGQHGGQQRADREHEHARAQDGGDHRHPPPERCRGAAAARRRPCRTRRSRPCCWCARG